MRTGTIEIMRCATSRVNDPRAIKNQQIPSRNKKNGTATKGNSKLAGGSTFPLGAAYEWVQIVNPSEDYESVPGPGIPAQCVPLGQTADSLSSFRR